MNSEHVLLGMLEFRCHAQLETILQFGVGWPIGDSLFPASDIVCNRASPLSRSNQATFPSYF